MNQANLSRRLILPILLVLIASFGILTIINVIQTRQILMTQGSEHIENDLKSSAGEIDSLCKRMLTITRSVSHLAEAESESGAPRDAVIDSFIKQTMVHELGYQGLYYNWSEELNKKYNRGQDVGPWWVRNSSTTEGIKSIADTSTTYYWQESEQSQWYWLPKRSKQSEWTEPYVDQELNITLTTLATPAYTKDGTFAGVAGIDIDLSSFIEIAKNIKLSAHSETFLISKNGAFIFHSNPIYLQPNSNVDNMAAKFNRTEFSTLKTSIASAMKGKIDFIDSNTGKKSWLYWVKIPSNDWVLASSLPISDVTEPALGTIATSIIIAISATLLGISVILIILRSQVIRPLTVLTSQAEVLAAGKPSINCELNQNSEIAALSNKMDYMVSYLDEMAGIASKIANGDLSVQVVPRSQEDRFGNAFQRMIEMLRSVSEVANQIAKGDLSVEIKVQSNTDAFGNAFQKMVGNLRSMAEVANQIAKGDLSVPINPQSSADIFGNAFKKMTESLRAIIKELMEGVQNLSSAANELVAVATYQTDNLFEQANFIKEITLTLDEIRKIVDQASTSAYSVVQVAEQSLDISQAGQKELDQVVDAMVKIKDQVETIAENIIDLNEKTVQIGEITSTVNEIAEQSHLLSVNAAIEASKAGEAGRGFSVVAVEVKNLATRSKKATLQVKNILSEIQKATNSTVIVTEEGSKYVESGVGQVYRIGSNIKSLHKVIVESSTAAKQIASTTNQQVVSIENIAVAMKQISNSANKGVTSAQQQQVTAQSLSQLANSLNNIVNQYRL